MANVTLLAEAAASAKPIYPLDAWTYWVRRIVAEVVFRDITAPDTKVDTADVLKDKSFYFTAVSGSRNLVDSFSLPGGCPAELVPLLQDSNILVTTQDGQASFYPPNIAYNATQEGELGVLEFLHAMLHMRAYMGAIVTQVCVEAGEAVYTSKGLVELWAWLVPNECETMPVSMWEQHQLVTSFMRYTRALYDVYLTAQQLTAFNEASTLV